MWIIPTPWGPIQIHFCADELIMLMTMLGLSGGTIAWVRSKFKKHAKEEVKQHHDCCHPDDKHEEK